MPATICRPGRGRRARPSHDRRPPIGPLPPIAVLLGGPSAEHDVSVVSGTAIAEAARRRRADRRAGPDRPRRRLVVAPDRPPRRGVARRRPPGTTRGPRCERSGADRRRGRPAGGQNAGTGRVRRPPRPVRRGRHDPGAPRGRRPGLHRVGRGRLGDRDGQGDLQAPGPRDRPAGRRLARGRSAPLGGRSGRRSWSSSRRSRPGPETRG